MICEECSENFQPYRKTQRFCRAVECKKRRQRKRWDRWKEREETKGTFRSKINKQQQAYRQRTGYARDYELRTKYGITLDEWFVMLDKSDHKCEICGRADEVLCVDHDHETGAVRGVLCRKCNRAIGQLGDSLGAITKVYDYFKKAYNLG